LVIEDMFVWLREEENLSKLRTASTLAFIFIFVLYFYGFRTGFQLTIRDALDLVADLSIMFVSAILVMYDFAQKGFESAMKEDEEEDSKVKELNKLIEEHKKAIAAIDEDLVGERLVAWNEKERQRAVERKKSEKVSQLKSKMRRLRTKKQTRRNERKQRRLQKKIDYFSNPDTQVKAKYEHVEYEHLVRRHKSKLREKKVKVDYSPVHDTVSSQSGVVIFMLFVTTFLRMAVEPTTENMNQLLAFLGILIPFLVMRSIWSYKDGLTNTKEKLPSSIRQKIKIIEWCQKEKPLEN